MEFALKELRGKKRWMPRAVSRADHIRLGSPAHDGVLPEQGRAVALERQDLLTRRWCRVQVWESQGSSDAVLGPPALTHLRDRPSEAWTAWRLSSLSLYFMANDGAGGRRPAHFPLLTLSMLQPRHCRIQAPGTEAEVKLALARKPLSPSSVSSGSAQGTRLWQGLTE